VVEEREKKEEKARAGEERLLKVSRWYGTGVTGFSRTGVGDESVTHGKSGKCPVRDRLTGLQPYRT
jgi:hypothetical protein